MPKAGAALAWITFAACTAALVQALLKPLPVRQREPGAQVVRDMSGSLVPLPKNIECIELGWGADLGDYLLATDKPGLLHLVWPVLKLHLQDRLLGDVYPKLARDPGIWAAPMDGGPGSLGWEAFLKRHDPRCVLLGWPQLAEQARSMGMTYVSTRQQWDEASRYQQIRLFGRLTGTEDRAGHIIERRRMLAQRLDEDLPPRSSQSAITVMPSGMEGALASYFGPGQHLERDLMIQRAHAAYVNPQRSIDNVEKIIALDPDMVLVMDHVKPNSRRLTPDEFVVHPVWHVLRAAKARQVYYWRWENPLPSRWLAELAYPDRLDRSLRDQVAWLVAAEYGYQLDEPQLDRLIGQDRNRSMSGTGRFERRSRP